MKTKNIFISIFLAIGFSFIVNIAKAKQYDDKQFKFKINVPDQWNAKIYMDGTDKIYDFLSQDENVLIKLRSFKADAGLSMNLLTQVFEQNYLPSGSKRMDLIDKTSAKGIPGKNGTYLLQENGLDIGISVFYVIEKGQGYTLSVIIPTTMMEHYQQEVSGILKSFVIPGYEANVEDENASSGLGGIMKKNKGLGGLSGNENNEIETAQGIKISNVKMGDQLLSNTDLLNVMTTFLPQTPNIYVVFDWAGKRASANELKIAWIFDQNNYRIDETVYTFPDFDTQGTNNSALSMPYQGWPLGDYRIEFSIEGQIVYETKFSISEEIPETNQAGFASESDFGNTNQSDEKNLFEGAQSKGKAQIVINYDDYDKPDSKPQKSKAKKSDISGTYSFYKRSDGKNLLNFWHLQFNKDGTYVDTHELKEGNYRTGHEGIWSVEGDLLITKHISGNSSGTYKIVGDELISQGGDVTMYFKKK